MKTRSLMACAILALGMAGTVAVQAQSLKKVDGVLVDTNGMTVYTFDKDTVGDGKSVCNGPCATNWPPVPATDKVATPYSVVTRDDGSKQLAYKGKPLYLFAADKKPGDRAGDNVKDIWHVVKD